MNWSIAACLIMGIGVGNYLLLSEGNSTIKELDTARTELIAMNESKDALGEVVMTGYEIQREKLHTPEPVIGRWKYRKYLEENLIRPTDELCKEVEGQVVVSFFVDKHGKPQRFVIIRSLCQSADKEAIRLIKEGPKWTTSILPVKVKVKF